ncbi:MAG: hypothetical protein DRP68_03680 [Candidatus Omnitrophota bacterium]|nr:MAG: hypothetical protein DRP68_03680 [Candidatus Omnitrophota bacterium]HDN86283.1 insulinase family protein [Candidatus Omnitrophota bacterium]
MFKILHIDGVALIFSRLKDFSTAGMGIFIRVGARYEPKRLKGIAHFTEHMVFKGTKRFSYRDIKREIEGRGGVVNGYTSQEITAYYAQFLKKNLKITAEILLDMVTHPSFEASQIERERGVILEEIKMYNDLPNFRALSLLDKILWENHPLGEDVIGEVGTVKNIKKNDLEHFQRNYYLPPRMVICCVGDFRYESLIKLIKKKLLVSSKGGKRLKIFSPPHLRKRKILIENKSLDQTHLCIGFRGVSYRSRYRLVVELIHVIMGANMSSRLFEEVREKRGLCYDISTEVKKYRDSGAFIIHLGLDRSNIELAFKCILRELKKMKDKLVSSKELARAKDFLIGQMAMNLEKPQGRLFYLADSYLALSKIYTLKELKERIHQIDKATIQGLVKKLFDFQRVCVTCVGNVDRNLKEHLLKIIEKEV